MNEREAQEEVVDLSIRLNCGCVVVYMKNDLDRGRMFLCPRHINEDTFDSLRIVDRIAQEIKNGKTSFTIRGREETR